ncbi:MAG: MBL fold metallo-hydrolase [Ilumatobacteraceae bacterium]
MTVITSCVDVGQGDCTVILDQDSRFAMLVDCPAGMHSRVLAELEGLGYAELRVVIVSHSHMDHLGGVLEVIEAVGERFTGTLHFNQDSFMVTPVAGEDRHVAGRKLRALVNRASEFGDRVHRAEPPASAGTVGAFAWRVLAPTYAEILSAIAGANPNLASGIVMLKVGADVIVIGGDAQLSTWQRLAGTIPAGAVLRWPHHGGSLGPNPNANQMVLDILEPQVVIVSVGATNTHGHPSVDFFGAVGQRATRLLCTQATAACVAPGGSPGVCAGTVRIHSDGSGQVAVVPDTPNHLAVVAAFGNAQCLAASYPANDN